MDRIFNPQTDFIETADGVVYSLNLQALADNPILHVEHFGDLLRIRGQAHSRKGSAFSKTIPIKSEKGLPRASLKSGILLITFDNPPA